MQCKRFVSSKLVLGGLPFSGCCRLAYTCATNRKKETADCSISGSDFRLIGFLRYHAYDMYFLVAGNDAVLMFISFSYHSTVRSWGI